MVRLTLKETGRVLGTIAEEELAFLLERLQPEGEGDLDRYLDRATLAYLVADGCPPGLREVLERALPPLAGGHPFRDGPEPHGPDPQAEGVELSWELVAEASGA